MVLIQSRSKISFDWSDSNWRSIAGLSSITHSSSRPPSAGQGVFVNTEQLTCQTLTDAEPIEAEVTSLMRAPTLDDSSLRPRCDRIASRQIRTDARPSHRRVWTEVPASVGERDADASS